MTEQPDIIAVDPEQIALRLADAIAILICDSGFGADAALVALALGTVSGVVAKASGKPNAVMLGVCAIAEGVIENEILPGI